MYEPVRASSIPLLPEILAVPISAGFQGELMRTTKRFTPKVIARFIRQGRGEGTYEAFIPWHRVSRGDPASSGRSHLLMWRGRPRELLSDEELGLQSFASMLENLDDSLEQFKLDPEDLPHPLTAYGEGDPSKLFPGTERLAIELGIKHPALHEKGESALWRPTTDLVLVIKPAVGARHLLAIASKPLGWEENKRTVELLRLEREYWVRRGATWLLLTPALYEESVVLTLRRIGAWAFGEQVAEATLRTAAKVARDLEGRTVTQVLDSLGSIVGSVEVAQLALWQAVWTGVLPIDLRRGWRPHVPLKFITPEQFVDLNPVAARRSSWI